jgi:hypothetical protein
MNNGLHLSDLWAVVIGLGAFLILINLRDIYETIVPIFRQGIRRYIAIRITSSGAGYEDEEIEAENEAESPATTTQQNDNNLVAITQTERNALLLQAKAEALATMVNAGKIGETEGIKLVFGVSPSSTNPKYQAARAALKTELAKLEPGPVFRQTDGSQTTREGVVISPPYVEQN